MCANDEQQAIVDEYGEMLETLRRIWGYLPNRPYARAGTYDEVTTFIRDMAGGAEPPSRGFCALVGSGNCQYTVEAIALRHPNVFGGTVCGVARNRLEGVRDSIANFLREV